MKKASEIYTTSVSALVSIEGLICSLTLQPYTLSCLEKSAAQGGNSLGIDTKDGPLISVLLLSYWDKIEDDAKIRDTMRSVLEAIEKDSQERGTTVPFKFMNYSSSFQDPIGSYGNENKRRLQGVSKRHNPEALFQKAVPGGFKLFD